MTALGNHSTLVCDAQIEFNVDELCNNVGELCNNASALCNHLKVERKKVNWNGVLPGIVLHCSRKESLG